MALHDVLLVTDADGRIADANLAAGKLLGVPLEGLRGHRLEQCVAHLADGAVSAWVRSALAVPDGPPVELAVGEGESERVFEATLTSVIVHGTASHSPSHGTASPSHGTASPSHGVRAVQLRDVTSRVHAARASAYHEERCEEVGQLARRIAHDLNNLLTVIRGSSEFVRASLEPTSAVVDDLEAIGRATDQAEALTRALLAIGRRESSGSQRRSG